MNTFDFENLIPQKIIVTQSDYEQILLSIEDAYQIHVLYKEIRKARNKAAKQRRARTGRK